jgi:hypothetical protein
MGCGCGNSSGNGVPEVRTMMPAASIPARAPLPQAERLVLRPQSDEELLGGIRPDLKE